MTSSHTSNSTAAPSQLGTHLIRLVKGLRLGNLANMVLKILPDSLQSRVRHLQACNFLDTHGVDCAVVLPVDALKQKQRQALQYLQNKFGADQLGDYLEFGVFSGTSISCMYQVLQEMQLDQIRLFGFDSFEGMPAISAAEDEGTWAPGQFNFSIELTTEILRRRQVDLKRVLLTKGWFCNTLTPEFRQQHQITKASVIMVDCDLYSSTVDVLKFCEPLIQDEAVIFFDDWHSNDLAAKNLGEKKACDEFLQAHPEFTLEPFGTYACHAECFIIKRNSKR